MRSGAEGEHRTGEDAGRSRTLDATEALSLWQGGGQGLCPPYLPPQPVRQVRTRDATEGVAQATRGVFVVVLHSFSVGSVSGAGSVRLMTEHESEAR